MRHKHEIWWVEGSDYVSNNETTMKFGGFKGQMMLYPKQLLDIKNSI